MRPKVTVYLTCRDYRRFVGQAIDSVFDQLFEDWELLDRAMLRDVGCCQPAAQYAALYRSLAPAGGVAQV